MDIEVGKTYKYVGGANKAFVWLRDGAAITILKLVPGMDAVIGQVDTGRKITFFVSEITE